MGGMAGGGTSGMGGMAGSGTSGMGGMAGSGTAGMGGMAGMAGSGMAGMSGAGGNGGQSSVNGCNIATATDATGTSEITVTFPGVAFDYSPKCVKVSLNTSVVFNGPFVGHPMIGGEVVGTTLVPASSGPFVPVTNTGTTKTFSMTSLGTYPYYCTLHGVGLGMMGAVFVVP
jgi:plastocyanin